MKSKLVRNRRFVHYLKMLKKATGYDNWDYYARELDKMIREDIKKSS